MDSENENNITEYKSKDATETYISDRFISDPLIDSTINTEGK